MSDLTDFLMQRIAEDEETARAATPGPWRDKAKPDSIGGPYPFGAVLTDDYHTVCAIANIDLIGSEGYTYPPDAQETADAAHIARWDPARVLAECEAKRRIIQLHAGDHECSTYDRLQPGRIDNFTWVCGEDCSTVRVLALPYSAHQDYRQEWAP